MLGALSLGGCGGGGGTGGVTTPAPAPTPSPAPTASPTPSPTSSPTAYRRFAELTGDQRFASSCGGLRSNSAPPDPIPNSPFGQGFVVDYRATADSWTVTGDNGAVTFGPVDRDPNAPPNTPNYVRTVDGASQRLSIGTPQAGGTALEYTRGYLLTLRDAQYRCIFGVPTQLADLPAASFSYARTGVNGQAFSVPVPSGPRTGYSVERSTATLRYDAAGRVELTIRLIGTEQTLSGPATTGTELGTYTATLPIDRTRGIYGGALSSTSRQVDAFNVGGWFFGSGAGEAGIAVALLSYDPVTNTRVSALINVVGAR
ncbi:hypothetical protein [Sphingomonas guangdongensis]|nr:hypothetical protein [Sphingomonas guangdongensis]